ncbi:MAG: peptidoglycan editing factor PgeF [Pseudomonadota bacterium]
MTIEAAPHTASPPESGGGVEAITAPSLCVEGVRHGFFTRQGGSSAGIYASLNAGRGSNDNPQHVGQNRAVIAAHLRLSADRLVSMHQTHSADVLVLDAPTQDRPRVDGLVTDRPGIALGVLHADCAPVLFLDADAGVIGGAHAGWRGAAGGVLEATLAAMGERGAERDRIRVAIGPTIGPNSYEVGPEFKDPIVREMAEAEACFRPSQRAGHAYFDLPAYIVLRLKSAGVGTIEDLALDTYPDEARFFSYRRTTHRGEADYGRLLSAIALEG